MSNRVTWGEGAYAGFWLRFAGRLIDVLVVGTVTAVVAFVVAIGFGLSLAFTGDEVQPTPGQEGAVVLAVWLALILPDFIYDTFMTSRLGWTLGKRAVGVEVRRADGQLLSYGQAVGRWFGRIVSTIPLYLGFLWAGWDRRKQTWHDKFVKCFVVKSAQTGAPAPAGAPAAARPWGGYSGWGIPSAAPPEPHSGGFGQQGVPGARPGPEGWGQPAVAPGGGTAEEGEPDPPAAAPAKGGAPEESDWGRELNWESAEPRPAVEGDSLESARWAGTDAPGPRVEPAGPEVEAAGPEVEAAGPEVEAAGPEVEAAGPEVEAAGPELEPAGPESEPAPPPRRVDDPNVVGVSRAGVPRESAAWLEQVADQVDTRLDRVTPQWRSSPQAEAARACAFGLLLGHLATIYPHMAGDLAQVAESHPSFSTLAAGNRLATLQRIVADPRRAAAWLGPLIGAEDPAQVQHLLD